MITPPNREWPTAASACYSSQDVVREQLRTTPHRLEFGVGGSPACSEVGSRLRRRDAANAAASPRTRSPHLARFCFPVVNGVDSMKSGSHLQRRASIGPTARPKLSVQFPIRLRRPDQMKRVTNILIGFRLSEQDASEERFLLCIICLREPLSE